MVAFRLLTVALVAAATSLSLAVSVDAFSFAECSGACQAKLASCQSSAADGVARVECVQPYNSCINACFRGSMTALEAVLEPVSASESVAESSSVLVPVPVASLPVSVSSSTMVGRRIWPIGCCQSLCQLNNPDRPDSWHEKCASTCPPCEQYCDMHGTACESHARDFRKGQELKEEMDFCQQRWRIRCAGECRGQYMPFLASSAASAPRVESSVPFAVAVSAATSSSVAADESSSSSTMVGAPPVSCGFRCIQIADQWSHQAWRENECDAYDQNSKIAEQCSAFISKQAHEMMRECQSCCSTIYEWTHSCKVWPIPKFP